MRFAFTDEQRAFREAAAALLARECTPATVRAAWNGQPSETLWPALAAQGVLGFCTPESAGGLGLELVDLALLLEETGYAALPEPLVENALVAAPLLARAGLMDRVATLVSGETKWAVGFEEMPALSFGQRADAFLIQRQGVFHLVEAGEVRVQAVASVDRSRALATVSPAQGIPLALEAQDLDRVWQGAVTAISLQLIGLGQRCLDMAVAYVKERRQFGRPVGAFQAVQHHLANAAVDLSYAKPLAYRAAYACSAGDAQARVYASMAKAFAGDAAQRAADAALQCHGAMGYSYEYDLHLWMKRIWCLARDWGDATTHRARVARHLEIS